VPEPRRMVFRVFLFGTLMANGAGPAKGSLPAGGRPVFQSQCNTGEGGSPLARHDLTCRANGARVEERGDALRSKGWVLRTDKRFRYVRVAGRKQ